MSESSDSLSDVAIAVAPAELEASIFQHRIENALFQA